VAVGARREDRLSKLCERIVAGNGKALAVACDVTVDGDVEKAVERIKETFGGIDIVVANAGFGVVGRVDRLKLDDYRRQFETNIFGVLRTIQATAAEVKARKGSFALMGSVAAYVSSPGASPYQMSKAAVRSLGDALWGEMARDGVSVTTIQPGYVESEIRKLDNQGVLRPTAKDPIPRWLMMPADVAARKMVNAIGCRRREVVITGHGKVAVLIARHFPCLLAFALRRGAGTARTSKARKD
jgi:short-subunit dehydrogenase